MRNCYFFFLLRSITYIQQSPFLHITTRQTTKTDQSSSFHHSDTLSATPKEEEVSANAASTTLHSHLTGLYLLAPRPGPAHSPALNPLVVGGLAENQ